MQTVTPWEVKGNIDYDKLIQQFGTKEIPPTIYKKLKSAHPLLRRGVYFSHRDFDKWLAAAESGEKYLL